jgi:hypothetical protein
MSEFLQEKEIGADYLAELRKRFDENGNKVFLVDYSKGCALKAVEELFPKGDFSLFCVVEDDEVATEFAGLLAKTVGELCVIRTVDELKKCIEQVSAQTTLTDKGLKAVAANFKARFPKIILTKEDVKSGTALLHRELCKDTSKNGIFDGEQKAPYCFSDFIAECHYDFVLLDNIYALLKFEEYSKQSTATYDVGKCDRLDFLGNVYYARTAYSYKRLKNVVDSANACVMLSDEVVDQDAVYLYATLHLLHDEFSFIKARDTFAGLAYDYVEACERVCTDISYCREDDSILSNCLHNLKGNKQIVPVDISALKKHLRQLFKYMSEEELFLRAMQAHITYRMNGKCSNLNNAIEMMEDGSNEMVQCFCNMLFKDELKGELESALSSSHISKMNGEEIAVIFSTFLKYGVYHKFVQTKGAGKILRIKRDDSAFEYFVRTSRAEREDDEFTYSVLKHGSALLYKTVALQRLLDGREKNATCVSPVLVLANGDLEKVRQSLADRLPDYECTCDILSLTGKEMKKNTICVTNYTLFRETAWRLNIRSFVLFDVYPDVVILKTLLNKAFSYGAESAFMICNYGDLSGHFADMWHDELLCDATKAVLINNSEISLKEGALHHYSEIVQELDTFYALLADAVTYGRRGNESQIAERFNRILTDFTLKVTLPEKEVKNDLRYFASVASAYDGVFSNSACVGGKGESVCTEKTVYVKKVAEKTVKKQKVKQTSFKEKQVADDENRFFFNVCTTMLQQGCDLKENNCAACKDYVPYKTNRFKTFEESVKEFFTKTLQFVAKLEKEKLLGGVGETIHSFDEDSVSEDRLVVEEIKALQAQSLQTLEEINQKVENVNALFYVDYSPIKDIQDAVSGTLAKLLKKYYDTVMGIFYQASELAKAEYQTVNESFHSAHSDQ